MKLLKYNENRFYITSKEEAESIKRELHYNGKTLQDLADFMNIRRETLYRKLSFNEDYKHNYFLERELQAVKEFTGLEFEMI